jgi:hypothetical protein
LNFKRREPTYYSLLMKLEENDMKAYGDLHTILGMRKQLKLLDISIHEDFSFHVQHLVLLYLEVSFPFSLFLKELKKRKEALKIYIGILKKEREEEKLGRVFKELEMNQEYLLWMLRKRKKGIGELESFDITEKCLEFSIFNKMKPYTDILCDEINLINFQMENKLSVNGVLMNILNEKMFKIFNISPKRKVFHQLKHHKNHLKELKHLYENLNSQHPSNTFWKKKKIFELEFFLNYLFEEVCIENEEIFHYFILKELELPRRLFYCVQFKQYKEAIEVCLEMKNKTEWMKLRNHIKKYTPTNHESLLLKMDSVDVNQYSWRMKNLF